jgi:hypothetical protein
MAVSILVQLPTSTQLMNLSKLATPFLYQSRVSTTGAHHLTSHLSIGAAAVGHRLKFPRLTMHTSKIAAFALEKSDAQAIIDKPEHWHLLDY